MKTPLELHREMFEQRLRELEWVRPLVEERERSDNISRDGGERGEPKQDRKKPR